ncbi:MAG: GrdX family protein [Thermovirgaceae bacterium]|nr:GrdX family protein [Thermovirgaceae bacterium]
MNLLLLKPCNEGDHLDKFLIVTNNPNVFGKYPDSLLVDGSPVDVIREAGKFLVEGYVLWSSPLPPNGRLMENPFRSLVLHKSEESSSSGRDFLLVQSAEDRLSRMVFLSAEGPRGEDLAFMDLQLLEIALQGV